MKPRELDDYNREYDDKERGDIDYFALITAYKVIRRYRQTDTGKTDTELSERFEKWMDDHRHKQEKQIADMVVMDEMLRSFCFGEDINNLLGFELIPSEEHI